MIAYADTGFLVSLYLDESTTARAQAEMASHAQAVLITDFVLLEFRNALNLAVLRKRITMAERLATWVGLERNMAQGVFIRCAVDPQRLYALGMELSDRYSSVHGTRTLNLLHVAAAMILEAKVFFTFDSRQRAAALGEGMRVHPEK